MLRSVQLGGICWVTSCLAASIRACCCWKSLTVHAYRSIHSLAASWGPVGLAHLFWARTVSMQVGLKLASESLTQSVVRYTSGLSLFPYVNRQRSWVRPFAC